MKTCNFSLSIIVPMYNEERRVGTTFIALERFIAAYSFRAVEIIFVDDGSTDATAMRLASFYPNCPRRLVTYTPNRGKGYAVKQGMLAAAHDYALMLDADISTSMESFEAFIPHLLQGVPVVIGSRKAATANVVKAQAWHRQKLGELFAVLARLVTGVKSIDFSCGFKCFSRQAIKNLFSRALIERWSCDVEILYLAAHSGLHIQEVGVTWKDDEHTKFNLQRDAWQSLVDLIRIPWLHRKWINRT